MQDGGRAVVLLNRGTTDTEISVPWEAIGYPANVSANVRDLWAHKDLGKADGKFSTKVEPHGVMMITVKP